jgi:hypothetical protein
MRLGALWPNAHPNAPVVIVVGDRLAFVAFKGTRNVALVAGAWKAGIVKAAAAFCAFDVPAVRSTEASCTSAGGPLHSLRTVTSYREAAA